MKDTYSYIKNDIILAVGEKTKIKIGMLTSMELIYSGMVSKDVFSIALTFGSGYQGYSYNLYFSKESKTIKIGNETLSIISVNPNQLTLRK